MAARRFPVPEAPGSSPGYIGVIFVLFSTRGAFLLEDSEGHTFLFFVLRWAPSHLVLGYRCSQTRHLHQVDLHPLARGLQIEEARQLEATLFDPAACVLHQVAIRESCST